jgi:hypothetical protein
MYNRKLFGLIRLFSNPTEKIPKKKGFPDEQFPAG